MVGVGVERAWLAVRRRSRFGWWESLMVVTFLSSLRADPPWSQEPAQPSCARPKLRVLHLNLAIFSMPFETLQKSSHIRDVQCSGPPFRARVTQCSELLILYGIGNKRYGRGRRRLQGCAQTTEDKAKCTTHEKRPFATYDRLGAGLRGAKSVEKSKRDFFAGWLSTTTTAGLESGLC